MCFGRRRTPERPPPRIDGVFCEPFHPAIFVGVATTRPKLMPPRSGAGVGFDFGDTIYDRFTFMPFALHSSRQKMHLIPLIAATFFMVSGGPYGIEDILGGAGFGVAILILLVLPLIWSLPTALMIGELAAAIPAEGGFYVWVRRGLGPFWGYQEGWLSLTASIFDMALYPSIFTLYLGRFNPSLTAGPRGYLWSLAVVVLCFLWNLRGAPKVGSDSAWLFVLLLSPFAVFVVLGFWRGLTLHPAMHWGRTTADAGAGLSTAILVAMWNYMGWDNASTIARDVENPQHNYPRAMLGSAVLTAFTYALPLAAMAVAGLSPEGCTTGSWANAGREIGGPILAIAVIAGGIVCGIGMFNALAMSYARLPIAMAADSMLPPIFLKRNARGVPWVSLLACSLAWALALKLPFERLISIDLILYGSSLILEFVALIALRVREPELARPFRAGNFPVACLLCVGPTALIAWAVYASRNETILGSTSALLFASAVALLGPVLYSLTVLRLRRSSG
jgi:amino acid transporter